MKTCYLSFIISFIIWGFEWEYLSSQNCPFDRYVRHNSLSCEESASVGDSPMMAVSSLMEFLKY